MPASAQPSGTSDHPILILDDETSVLHSLRETLERTGYHVVTCVSPMKALEMVRDRPFSVILTDMRMPEMSGLEFLEHCEAMQPDATRVLITAVLSLSSVLEAINSGKIYRFIPKPWLHEELLETIENSVQRFVFNLRTRQLAEETSTLQSELAAKDRKLAEMRAAHHSLKTKLAAARQGDERRSQCFLELCWRILNTYDPFLGGRSRTIAELAATFAASRTFDATERSVLSTAAWLCDLGLLGVSREALDHARHQPEALTDSDRSLIRNHPVYSQTLAALIDDDPALGATIRGHHEHFDGSGFPDGLAGDEIPWAARCLAVVVAYVEADLPRSEGHEYLLEASGYQLDPEAVRLFITSTQGMPSASRSVREVPMDKLKPGMILSQGLYSPNGLLLVAEGDSLTPATIEKIRLHHFAHNFAPLAGRRLFVYT